MGQRFRKHLISVLFIGLSGLTLAKSTSSSTTKTSSTTTKRASNLSLMYNAWAINPNSVNGKGYLKSADSLTKEEYEALKIYFKPIATDATEDFKSIQSIANEQKNVYGLFNKIESKGPLNAVDVTRWKDNLNKLHKRLLAALERRVGDDPSYSEFLVHERERSLGNYQNAYAERTALKKLVPYINDKNETAQRELWSQVLKDPHTEMLIRMRQGVEILHATFLDFERQRFISKEKKNEGLLQHQDPTTADAGAEDERNVDPDTFLRKNASPYNSGPNPLLPPPIKD